MCSRFIRTISAKQCIALLTQVSGATYAKVEIRTMSRVQVPIPTSTIPTFAISIIMIIIIIGVVKGGAAPRAAFGPLNVRQIQRRRSWGNVQ